VRQAIVGGDYSPLIRLSRRHPPASRAAPAGTTGCRPWLGGLPPGIRSSYARTATQKQITPSGARRFRRWIRIRLAPHRSFRPSWPRCTRRHQRSSCRLRGAA